MGDFKHSGICWKDSTAGHKECRRFLECIGGAVGNVKLKGSSDHEIVEFRTHRAAWRVNKLTAMDLWGEDFYLFKNLLSRVSGNKTLEGRGAQESS